MDKVYAKIIFEKAGLKQAKYEYIKVYNDKYIYVCNIVIEKLQIPIFVKPSNSGSSVGVKKAESKEELINCILHSSQFDNKILLEQAIVGKEIECAVLGNFDVKASVLGEVVPADNFYSFDAKYKNVESQTIIPASLPQDTVNQIQKLAVKAFNAIDGKGFSRVDFFVSNDFSDIYINEINTIPGFTEISMYPKLWEHSGLSYSDLLDSLICLADEGI